VRLEAILLAYLQEMNPMLILNRRRLVVRTLSGAFAALATARPSLSQQPAAVPPRSGPLAHDHVQRFVQVAHSDLDTTRQMLDATPRLIRATWDWGGGDFETALAARRTWDGVTSRPCCWIAGHHSICLRRRCSASSPSFAPRSKRGPGWPAFPDRTEFR
jgi:hypothetical protein